MIDVFVNELDLKRLGFEGVVPEVTGRPSYHPGLLLKIYVYGYVNQVASTRKLECEAQRNIEMWTLTVPATRRWYARCQIPPISQVDNARLKVSDDFQQLQSRRRRETGRIECSLRFERLDYGVIFGRERPTAHAPAFETSALDRPGLDDRWGPVAPVTTDKVVDLANRETVAFQGLDKPFVTREQGARDAATCVSSNRRRENSLHHRCESVGRTDFRPTEIYQTVKGMNVGVLK